MFVQQDKSLPQGLFHYYAGYPRFTEDEWRLLREKIIILINEIYLLNNKDNNSYGAIGIAYHWLKDNNSGTDIPYTMKGIIELDRELRSKEPRILRLKDLDLKHFNKIKKLFKEIYEIEKIQEWCKDHWNEFYCFLFEDISELDPKNNEGKLVKTNKKEWEIKDIKMWDIKCLIGFICNEHKKYCGSEYVPPCKGIIPSKSPSFYHIKNLQKQLSHNPIILKEYIGWVFENKIKGKKKNLTSLGFFTMPEILIEYKTKFLFMQKEFKRNDKLPGNIATACARHNFNISTYGELAFVRKMPNQTDLLNNLKELNFDLNILDTIK